MTDNKTPSGNDFNINPINYPPPTYEEVVKMMKARKNQRETILYILKKFGFISSQYMKDVLNFYSGAKRISELIELGFIIKKKQDWTRNGIATYYYFGKQKSKILLGDNHE